MLLTMSAAAAASLAIAACGGSAERGGAGERAPAGARAAPPAGGPSPALAANVEQANRIVGEGRGDLEAKLESLEGHPVVVNQWASWCGPCRFEFPFFRAMAAKYRDRVAFVGLDSQDERDAAEEFLEDVPGDFPSIFDPDGSAAASLGGGRAFPTTFFFDAEGEQVHTKPGAYATVELLEKDIERFALGEG